MERKRLVNRANVQQACRSRRAFRLRQQGMAEALVVMLSLTLASCADYETDYQQSVESYTNGPPRAAASAESGAAASSAAAPSGSADGPISYGSGSTSGSGTGSGAGSGSQEGFSTIGSGASGVIVPGG